MVLKMLSVLGSELVAKLHTMELIAENPNTKKVMKWLKNRDFRVTVLTLNGDSPIEDSIAEWKLKKLHSIFAVYVDRPRREFLWLSAFPRDRIEYSCGCVIGVSLNLFLSCNQHQMLDQTLDDLTHSKIQQQLIIGEETEKWKD